MSEKTRSLFDNIAIKNVTLTDGQNKTGNNDKYIINIKDEIKFRNILTCLAARSGELLVYQELANEVGIDIKTA